jgi:hypothetical protein
MVADEQGARIRSARRWRVVGTGTRVARILILAALLGLLVGIPAAITGVELVGALLALELVHRSTARSGRRSS